MPQSKPSRHLRNADASATKESSKINVVKKRKMLKKKKEKEVEVKNDVAISTRKWSITFYHFQ